MTAVLHLIDGLLTHPLLTTACLLPLGAVAALHGSRPARALLIAAVSTLIGLFLLAAVWYLVSPAWLDHVEANTACVSALFAQGHSTYHAIDAPERYSLLYGPHVFIASGLAMRLLGAGTFAAKLPGVVLAVASLGLVVVTVVKAAGRSALAPALAYHVFAALFFRRDFAFWNRGDSQLLFWTSLGLWACLLRGPTVAGVVLGVALGAAVDVKVHALLYFLPLFALAYRRHGGRTIAAAAVSATLIGALPFLLFSNVSLPAYVAWLQQATGHPFCWGTASDVLERGTFLALPLLIGAAYRGLASRSGLRAAVARNRGFLFALAVASAGVLAVGSKDGAGAHHLMPLAPLLTVMVAQEWSIAVGMRVPRSRARTILRAAVVSTAAAGLLLSAREAAHVVRQVAREGARAARVVEDLDAVSAACGARIPAMACGESDETYSDTFYQTELIYSGRPCPICLAALMDMGAGHLPLPQALRREIRDGSIDVWLVPKGEAPFTMQSYYSQDDVRLDLFDDEFRRTFEENYRITGHSEFFDLWTFVGDR